jgi:uncharacterized protein YcfL
MTVKHILLLALLTFSLMLAACTSQTEEPAAASEPEGNLALVDSAAIEELNAHQYVVVKGNYPDACTKVSNVDQTVEGNTFTIDLYTDKPGDLVCAQMLSPFSVNILLETGGLVRGDYTVNVNNSASTTLRFGN